MIWKKLKDKIYIYILLEDDYGGTFSSSYKPVGATFSRTKALDWTVERRYTDTRRDTVRVKFL